MTVSAVESVRTPFSGGTGHVHCQSNRNPQYARPVHNLEVFSNTSASCGVQCRATMRVGSYTTVVICAVFFSSGSAGPVWLCVRADGLVGLKANAEAPCESACSGELDGHDENVPVGVSAPDDCCLDIPIGLGGKPQPARPQKADPSPAPTRTAALCTLSVPTGGEFGLLTRSHPPGLSRLSDMIRTVVLLI